MQYLRSLLKFQAEMFPFFFLRTMNSKTTTLHQATTIKLQKKR